MEVFTEEGFPVLLRWIHVGAGVTWIGLLYYFNFVQAPFFAQTTAEVKGAATRQLVPRALAWFRYAALVTWAFGLILWLYQQMALADGEGWDTFFESGHGVALLSGMLLGTIMFLNVWGVIWPNQKIVIGSAEAAATGGQADPRAADATRRGLLASRTNVVLSIPMLFFMVSSSHLALANASSSARAVYWGIFAIVTLAVEGNALAGLTGVTKRPLETPSGAIVTGLLMWAFLLIALETAHP